MSQGVGAAGLAVTLCAWCGAEFEHVGIGRPRRYCSLHREARFRDRVRRLRLRPRKLSSTCAYLLCDVALPAGIDGRTRYCPLHQAHRWHQANYRLRVERAGR